MARVLSVRFYLLSVASLPGPQWPDRIAIAATNNVALRSLGFNAHELTMALAELLIHLREDVTARRIYWVLPARSKMIGQIARARKATG